MLRAPRVSRASFYEFISFFRIRRIPRFNVISQDSICIRIWYESTYLQRNYAKFKNSLPRGTLDSVATCCESREYKQIGREW